MKEVEFHVGSTVIAGLDNQVQGDIIIGLHGFLDNAESLRPLAPYLDNYRFIILDLAGHGKSSHRPLAAHYNQVDYLQDLFAILTDNDWKSVTLLGHSLGGILCTLFAGMFPEYCKGVISLDSCGPLTKPEDTTAQQMRESVLSRYEKSRNRLRMVDLDTAVEARCKVTDTRPQDARKIIQRNLTQDASGHCFWSSDPRLRTRSTVRLTEGQAENIMRHIDCPVLFTSASTSFKQVDAVYSERKQWFKQSQCVAFDGGHHVHMEKPDEIGPVIREFVDQL